MLAQSLIDNTRDISLRRLQPPISVVEQSQVGRTFPPPIIQSTRKYFCLWSERERCRTDRQRLNQMWAQGRDSFSFLSAGRYSMSNISGKFFKIVQKVSVIQTHLILSTVLLSDFLIMQTHFPHQWVDSKAQLTKEVCLQPYFQKIQFKIQGNNWVRLVTWKLFCLQSASEIQNIKNGHGESAKFIIIFLES